MLNILRNLDLQVPVWILSLSTSDISLLFSFLLNFFFDRWLAVNKLSLVKLFELPCLVSVFVLVLEVSLTHWHADLSVQWNLI